MKFEPRPPDRSVNTSREHPLSEMSTLLAGAAGLAILLAVAVHYFVEVVVFFLPVEVESELFDGWTPEQFAAIEDPRLPATQSLVDRLNRYWSDSPYQFRVSITEVDEPNAMAFPGGLIVVTDSLLNQVGSENELAFVLGHEIGHFHNRDHLRRLGGSVLLDLVYALATGASEFTGLVTAVTNLGFDRDQESEADWFGLRLVYNEYGHVAYASDFFAKLARTESGGSRLASYFASHPQSPSRVAELQEWAEQEGWPTTGTAEPLPW